MIGVKFGLSITRFKFVGSYSCITRLTQFQDLKPTNILLELESPEAMVARYLLETSPLKMVDLAPSKEQNSRSSEPSATEASVEVPATEFVTTQLISTMKEMKVRIIDLGVCTYLLGCFRRREPEC